MANAPAQSPNIDLPLAEYLSLSPNRTVALQGRRRQNKAASSVSIPAGGVGSTSFQFVPEFGFVNGSGIYLHDVWLMFVPSDTSSELQITAIQMGFGTSNVVGDIFYRVGTPLLTLTTPSLPTIASSDRDKLILYNDIIGVGDFNPGTNLLVFAWTIALKNLDATNAHSATSNIGMIYTRLDGVVE